MKKLNWMLAPLLAVFVLQSCEDPAGQTPEENADLAFELKVENVDLTSADVVVMHNGTADDTWFGFITTELTVEQAEELRTLAARYAKDAVEQGLYKGNTKTIALTSLEPGTTYRYVVCGVTQDAAIYGNVATITFTTMTGEGEEPDPTPDSGEGDEDKVETTEDESSTNFGDTGRAGDNIDKDKDIIDEGSF